MLAPEHIADSDQVSRLIERPRMYERESDLIIPLQFFPFFDGRPESVVWRRYAATDEEVHKIGIDRIETKRRRTGNDDIYHDGFATAQVDAVRSTRTVAGHGFNVVHAPCEGKWHAHVELALASDKTFRALAKGEKADLRFAISQVFSNRTSS